MANKEQKVTICKDCNFDESLIRHHVRCELKKRKKDGLRQGNTKDKTNKG
jgi:hypothetical protein